MVKKIKWYMIANYSNLVDVLMHFKDNDTCKEFIEKARWGENICCPLCGGTKVYISKRKKFDYICGDKDCKQQIFSVIKGTIFENSPIPLQKWFGALWLLTCHKKGISSCQLARDLGITQKSAWFVLHRIRYAITTESFNQPLGGIVEVDETYIGGKNKNRHSDKKIPNSQGRSIKDKTPVFGMLSRGGDVRTIKVGDTKKGTLQPIIVDNVESGSTVMSDEWWAYHGLDKLFPHFFVNHGKGEYVSGDCHTNTLEGFWSLFKRGIIGTYHSISPKHLDMYLSEFEFRYNSRHITDTNRFDNTFTLCDRRLRYDDLIGRRI